MEFDLNELAMLIKIIEDQTKAELSNNESVITAPVEKKEEPIQKPKRCQHDGCKVKLMLADFPCRCKGFYCSQHRASELHKCSFDYKTSGKNALEKQMPTVVADKLERI